MNIEALQTDFANFLAALKDGPAGSLLARADEMRWRLVRTTVVTSVVFIACFIFAKPIFGVLKQPLAAALPSNADVLHFTGPMEVFVSYVKVSFLFAAIITAPYAFHQLWGFIGPALPSEQRGAVLPFAVSSLLLFLAGLAFCFFGMLPTALQFLLGMGGSIATPMITVDDYISLLLYMLLGFGLVFQLPLVVIVLERLEVISLAQLRGNRAGVLVAILVVAAVATPTPDPFSQLAMATPMYLMFEIALLVIVWMNRKTLRSAVPTKTDA